MVACLRGQDGIAASCGGKHQKPVAAGLAGIALQYHVIPGKEHHALFQFGSAQFRTLAINRDGGIRNGQVKVAFRIEQSIAVFSLGNRCNFKKLACRLVGGNVGNDGIGLAVRRKEAALPGGVPYIDCASGFDVRKLACGAAGIVHNFGFFRNIQGQRAFLSAAQADGHRLRFCIHLGYNAMGSGICAAFGKRCASKQKDDRKG